MNQIKDGSGLWLIDVRSAAAYAESHIEGSVNIPRDVLAHKKFAAQKVLVLVDDSLGQKAARESAEVLAGKGQERVSVLEGGIVSWKLDGLPLVESGEQVRGVTAGDLKWAIANNVPMKIYDLRDGKIQKQQGLKRSEAIPGNFLPERVEKLKKMLAPDGKKKDLANRIRKTLPVVLVFAASEDAAAHTKAISHGVKGDIRYLIGGYESMISEKLRSRQTIGECPTCPGEKGSEKNAK